MNREKKEEGNLLRRSMSITGGRWTGMLGLRCSTLIEQAVVVELKST
jgi:hypothetical protein